MKQRIVSIMLIASVTCMSCGSDDVASPAAATAIPESVDVAGPSAEAVTTGDVAFVLDGQAIRFHYLPKNGNSYMPAAASITAAPSAGGREKLQITFLSIDLRQISFPTDLPPPKDISQPMGARAAMATIGFSYTDAEGNEWSGPGKIHVASYDSDGLLQATFSNVSLPHTGGKLPRIALTDGEVRAVVKSPW